MGRMTRKMPPLQGIDAMITGQTGPGVRSARNYKGIPILGRMQKAGLDKEKEWSQEQFEDEIFGNYLENSNRPTAGQTCIEKKGPSVDCAKCDFACFLDCQLKTIEWRQKEMQAEFKEAHFSKDEGMALFALLRTIEEKIKLVQRAPGAPGNRHIQRAAEKAIQDQANAVAAAGAKNG